MAKKGLNIYMRKDGRWEGRYKNGYTAEGKAKYSLIPQSSKHTRQPKKRHSPGRTASEGKLDLLCMNSQMSGNEDKPESAKSKQLK